MKRNILIAIIFLIFIACNTSKTKESNSKKSPNKKTINLIINNWHKAASEANFNNYFNKMDSISVFIGTDASENWNKKDFAAFSKPYFDKGKAWDFKPLERNIYFSENQEVIWFDELLKTWMGICRGSGVLEKKDNKWKIKHYVLSITIPNDNVLQIFNINKVKDSLFLSTKYKYDNQ